MNPHTMMPNTVVMKHNVDKEISKLADSLFQIDCDSKIILAVIAKHGPINEKQILDFSCDLSHNFNRDTVRYRFNAHRTNPHDLISEGFVVKMHGNKTGNLPTHENIYRLTLKGFLASLAKTRFIDNYLIKTYGDFISQQSTNPTISQFAMLLVKYNVALFMCDSMLNAMDLTRLDDIDSKILKMNESSLVDPTYFQVVSNAHNSKLLLTIRFWLHVYSQVFNKITEKAARGHKYKIVKQIEGKPADAKSRPAFFVVSDLPKLVKSWYYYLPKLQYEDLNSFDPEAEKHTHSLQNVSKINVDINSVNSVAKNMLKKYHIPASFPSSELPMFF